MRRLFWDTRGEATSNTLGFALTWFVTFSVFLMNVQLAQLFHRRDVVDHAAAIAVDTAKKTYCMKEENAAATQLEVKRAIQNVLDTAGGDCELAIVPGAGGLDEGATGLDLSLKCSFDCQVPIASRVMCKGGKSQLDARLTTVAMGCDGRGS